MKCITDTDLKCFNEFYAKLENKQDIFYMYFSENLLHYVLESTSLIQRMVNLILITSGLKQSEIETIKKIINRPHINLTNKYTDGHIWDMLVENNEFNFGWIDSDCFIFNNQLFNEIKTFPNKNIAINTVWSSNFDDYDIHYFANTYFLFINIDIYKHISSLYPNVTMMPSIYNINHDKINSDNERIINDELFNLLKINGKKMDKYFYDTTFLYQTLVRMEGFEINRIRNLNEYSTYYSKEALHLGGGHKMYKYILENSLKRIYFRFNMRFSFYLLYKNLFRLPEEYRQFYDLYEKNMIENKLSTNIDDVIEKIQSYAKQNDIRIFDFFDKTKWSV